jgi:hypothetical protein
VEKYGRGGQATDEVIIRRVRFASLQIKTTETHSEHVILIALQSYNRDCASTLRLSTLPIYFTTVLNCNLLRVL